MAILEKVVHKSKWAKFVFTIPMKLTILTFCGGAVCVFPFLMLIMQQLGITFPEIAIMFLVTPAASLIGPVFSGLIADKVGKYSLILITNIMLMGLSFNLLLFVPPVPGVFSQMSCNAHTDQFSLTLNNCKEYAQTWGNGSINATIQNCKSSCLEVNAITENCNSSCLEVNATTEITLFGHLNLNPSSDKCDMFLSSLSFSNTSHPATCSKEDCLYNMNCELLNIQGSPVRKDTFGRTFNMALFSLFFGMWFAHSAFSMMDVTTIAYCKTHDLELGKEKIMSMLGFGLTPLLAGALIDAFSKDSENRNYAPAFALGGILLCISIIILLFLNIQVESTKTNIIHDVGKLLRKGEVLLFLLIVLILGTNMGFIEAYLFIFLKSLNAPSFLLGLTMTVGCLASIPMLFFAEAFEKKVGRQNIFFICFTAYAARMLGYSYIYNPWMCLVFESLEAFTYQLMWLTCLKMCPILATRSLLATMSGLTGSVHYAFGRGIGGFLGGYLIETYTIRIAYRVFSGIALGGGFFYLFIHHLFLKKILIIREKELNEADHIQNELDELNRDEKKAFLDDKATEATSLSNNLNASIVSLSGTMVGNCSVDNYTEDPKARNRHIGKSMPRLYPEISDTLEQTKFSRSEANLFT